MYHYTESGLPNVWLKSGYVMRKTPYGEGVAVRDVVGLHKAICDAIVRKPSLTAAELRFLRKEVRISRRRLAGFLRAPATDARVGKKLYLEHVKAWSDVA